MRNRWLFVLALLVFLGVTNRWLPWQDAIDYAQSYDVYWYQLISKAAPAFPAEPVSHHHAQRFFFHYIPGLLSHATGVPLPVAYRALWALLTLALVILVDRVFRKLALKNATYWICMAALLLNPYALRFNALAFGMVQDAAFLAATAAVLLGLLEGCMGMLLVGCAAAALARQTAVMLMPGIALWMLFGDSWQNRSRPRRLLGAAAACALIVGIYIGTDFATRLFSTPSQNVAVLFGIFHWAASGQFSPAALGDLLLRTIIPFAVPAGLLLGFGDLRNLRRPDSLAALLMVACISAQPVLAGPLLTGRNASRLSALGLVFAAFILARALSWDRFRPGPRLEGAILAVLAVASFHHLYSAVGPSGPAAFAGLQLALAMGLLALGKVSYRMG